MCFCTQCKIWLELTFNVVPIHSIHRIGELTENLQALKEDADRNEDDADSDRESNIQG